MSLTHKKEKDAVIAQLLDMLEKRLPKEDVGCATRFAKQYYARIAPSELLNLFIDDLYGALLSHWHLARRRKPGKPLLRIYNPLFEEHGWQSTHTVIEVIVDDMPFLVDSLNMGLIQLGINIHFTLFPVIPVRRDVNGNLLDVLSVGSEGKDVAHEAFIRFEVDRHTDPQLFSSIHKKFLHVLMDVRLVVDDWKPMQAKMGEIIEQLTAQSLPVAQEEKEESIAFLRWVEVNHFTFIGFRGYELVEEAGEDILRVIADSGLGIFRNTPPNHVSRSFAQLPSAMRSEVREPSLLIITKSTAQSPLHRPAHMDYLGIKRFNDAGEVIGEWRFLGLYSSSAYSLSPNEIPILRRKEAWVLAQMKLSPNSHVGKAIKHILTTFPRDEMFQASAEELLDITTGILQAQDRNKPRLFLRQDPFGRFISAFVYVPRDRYNTEIRLRIHEILMQAFDGQSSEFDVQFTEGVLARVLFIIQTNRDHIPEFDVGELEQIIATTLLSWEDELELALLERYGEGSGVQLTHKYGKAFPSAYREDFISRTAVSDIDHLENISATKPLDTQLYRPVEESDDMLRFKVYGSDSPMPLSDVLPILERMGLRVLGARPYEIEMPGGERRWILDFVMTAGQGIEIEVLQVKKIFQEAFSRVCSGEIENDGFNRLVLAASLNWRMVMLLRGICKYLLQTHAPFSQVYMESTLAKNSHIANLLSKLFMVRFDPKPKKDTLEAEEKLTARIVDALDTVNNLDEDRILRRYLAVIQAMLRTNYFQRDKNKTFKPYFSFKLDSSKVLDLPLPRPMFEIFVYAPWVEGIHLRGGKVARGGLRWSDRREDFRTEVLGLMKAQMVKNSVIVPVGAKGGFIAKKLPDSSRRDALQNEVIHCYRTFICGLLDLTDNLLDGKIVSPPEVVRYDENDAYLVVAADKGTATFSDIANDVAADYNFWLGDGFASGGSSGYDHKKIGITARGAWESVKRHFYELGINCQQQDFTVLGIGDMSGDVFGNGMLLSRHIKLIVAFNHLHIFIDPNPDPERSYQERERLFNLPNGDWREYDKELISAGGGIYSRNAKSVQLSTEARQVLGIEAEILTPSDLIQGLLRAPVDLLWNGGIGTYVKASQESHDDVGDRYNVTLRIDARELRCKVVAEGGNLGFTQLARVEFARNGGLINTDFIDNSAGVDCSDHEVNIKILLNQVMRAGDMTLKQRNQLLVNMTDDVAALVLHHNYLQTQALSIDAVQAHLLPSEHIRLIKELEREGRLKRKLEFLPGDAALIEREQLGEGLARPEIAVLLSHSKIKLFEELCNSSIGEINSLASELIEYFPRAMHDGFTIPMQAHPLRLEIIATQISNSMVNRMGSTFVLRMKDETGHDVRDIACAFTTARELYRVREVWDTIESLDKNIPAQIQNAMLIEIRHLLDRTTVWLLRNRRSPIDSATTVAEFADKVAATIKRIPKMLQSDTRTRYHKTVRQYSHAAVPAELAQQVAIFDAVYPALDLVEIQIDLNMSINEVTDAYFKLGFALDLFWLHDRIQELSRRDYWQRKARMALRYDLYAELRVLTKNLLQQTSHLRSTKARLAHWLEENAVSVDHWRNLLVDIQASGVQDLAMLSVAMREIRSFGRVGASTHD